MSSAADQSREPAERRPLVSACDYWWWANRVARVVWADLTVPHPGELGAAVIFLGGLALSVEMAVLGGTGHVEPVLLVLAGLAAAVLRALAAPAARWVRSYLRGVVERASDQRGPS